MITIESAVTTIRAPGGEYEVDEAQLAAVSFFARYNGRTLEAYRHPLSPRSVPRAVQRSWPPPGTA